MARLTLLMLLCVGCSSATSGAGACAIADDCGAGEVCVDGACAKLCRNDSQCPAGNICGGDVCRPGQRTDLPQIAGIDGEGAADGASGHTAHHLLRRLRIEGQHFTGSAVTLSDASASWELSVCEGSDTQLLVDLPDGLTGATSYRLSVATQAGACDTTLPVLQGEQGPAGTPGSPDTPQQVLDKLLLVDGGGSGLDADTLDGMDSGAFLPVTSLSTAQAATLTGGGNADALHTHAAQPSPWFVCGSIADLATNCLHAGYPATAYEYGIAYNQLWPTPILCSSWNHGLRLYNELPYMVESDNPEAGMRWGGFAFYRGTDATGDDVCSADSFRHTYWRLGVNTAVESLGGNNSVGPANPCFSTDLPLYCRERF